jgi:hypothetical protein
MRIFTYNGRDFTVRAHFGGAGGGPMYTLQFTEQEILGFIREKMAALGINMTREVPEYTAMQHIDEWMWDNRSWPAHIAINLFDSETNVGVALVNSSIVREIAHDFARQNNDITLGLFNVRRESIRHGNPDDEILADIFPVFYDDLTAQVNQFISVLRAQGIIE